MISFASKMSMTASFISFGRECHVAVVVVVVEGETIMGVGKIDRILGICEVC